MLWLTPTWIYPRQHANCMYIVIRCYIGLARLRQPQGLIARTFGNYISCGNCWEGSNINKRDLKLDQYNISRYTYRELHNFCLQYPEKKRQLAWARSPYNSPTIDLTPNGSDAGRQAEKTAERATILAQDVELIDRIAKEAGGKDADNLLIAVTQGVPTYYLKTLRGMETGERQFNSKRRLFFYLLAKEMKKVF